MTGYQLSRKRVQQPTVVKKSRYTFTKCRFYREKEKPVRKQKRLRTKTKRQSSRRPKPKDSKMVVLNPISDSVEPIEESLGVHDDNISVANEEQK